MGNPRETYLIRTPDGKMRSVVAHSSRGAATLFIERYRTRKGDILDVKPRGRGEWSSFKVT